MKRERREREERGERKGGGVERGKRERRQKGREDRERERYRKHMEVMGVSQWSTEECADIHGFLIVAGCFLFLCRTHTNTI